jgi:Trk K+ transport system NAD-binding subunit
LLEYLHDHPSKKKRRIVLRADSAADAAKLYHHGADYVIQPQLSSGQYFGNVIGRDRTLKILDKLRDQDKKLTHEPI